MEPPIKIDVPTGYFFGRVCSTDNFLSPTFLRIFKVSSMLHHGSVGRVHSKECYFTFKYTFLAFSFFVYFFFCFPLKKCVFVIFIFFLISIELPQQDINQSETGIGDNKLSAELNG